MAELSKSDINDLENKINALSQQTATINNRIDNMNSSIQQVGGQLQQLVDRFEEMMSEQKKSSALQQAATELVRVRQELENNFGNYKVVRETMLGVLQATDLALVKKTTISRVSEELMLSTPKYWLAPCLVAVSAWIGNDRDLAERAIAEAVKRDEERTALTMALVCRRNNKVQTCYEWLSIYFAKQNASDFSEGTFTYLDAYVNGVFGPDDKHVCDDYINKWINEIRGASSVFEKEQEDMWKGYCEKFSNRVNQVYPDLSDTVQEYNRIDAYVGRINSVDTIVNNFNTITNAYVDQERLKATIDKNLITLVSRYDVEEEPLRKEEEYLKTVKAFEGDKEAAKRDIAEKEKLRKVKALNLVEQMSKVVVSDDDVSPSEKKTAVSFLSGYIKKGFNSYITEKKDEFPESITMNINGWMGKTVDGSNYNQLCSDYDNYLGNMCSQELNNVNTNAPKSWMIASIVVGVLAIIMMIVALPVGIVMVIGAGACALMINKSKKDIANNIASINQKYMDMSIQGKNKLSACITQWNDAKNTVYQFNSNPIKEIIA